MRVASIVDDGVSRRRALFFENLESVFQRVSLGRASIREVRLGTRRIRMRFADQRIEQALVPALSQLLPEPAPVASMGLLDFAIWGGEAHPPSPTAPWSHSDIGPRGAIDGFNTDRYRTAFNSDSLVMSAFDRQSCAGYFWARSPETLPLYELAAPLRTLFAWGLETWGWQMVHAAAVCGPKGAALLVGRGGSGKSSSALSCLHAGLGYLSDDYCALESRAGRAYVHSVYRTGKLEPLHMRRFLPKLQTMTQALPRGDEKKTVLLVGSQYLAREAPIVTLLLPEIGGQRCAVTPVGSGLALRALAPSSIFQGPALAHTTFQFLAELTRSLPCARLTLGPRADEIPDTLRALVG